MRGQIILEFLMITTLAVLVGLIYLGAGTSLFHDATEQQRIAALNDVGYMVQDEFILGATVSDGYVRSFTLPAKADRFPYSVSNDGDTLTLQSGGVAITYDLPPFSGTLQQGTNVLKKDGVIKVNE